MLQSMLENIPHGISVVDADQKLVAWNTAYVDLFDYPPAKVVVGVPVAELIEHNIRTGWIDGDPAEQARRRVAHMRSGRAYTYERRNPDG
jgi:PAS domain-containing protein